LTWPFKILSASVWASFSIWGVWIAVYYGSAGARRDWNAFNIVFPDLYSPEFSTAALGIGIHFFGAAFMAIAGVRGVVQTWCGASAAGDDAFLWRRRRESNSLSHLLFTLLFTLFSLSLVARSQSFQLVKYIRKEYPIFHRWVGRCYIVASLIASIGGLVFICFRGSYGGRQANIGFGAYGVVFFVCGVCTYYYAVRKEFNTHKLWAWRLYSLSLASWMWRFDYYWIMALFGTTSAIHNDSYRGVFDYFQNWAFFVPNLIVVEIIYRWGENATLSSFWMRVLDVCYGILWIVAMIFSFHAAMQLWIPSVTGSYDAENGWIL
jgi:hypothetical protein